MGGARRFTQQLGKTVGRQRMMRHDGPGTRSSFDIAEAAEAQAKLNRELSGAGQRSASTCSSRCFSR
jgi:hypothetical protein